MSRRLLQLVIPVTPERRMFRIHDPSVDPDAPGGPLPPVGALISTNREQLWVGSLQEDIDVRVVLEEWDGAPPPCGDAWDEEAKGSIYLRGQLSINMGLAGAAVTGLRLGGGVGDYSVRVYAGKGDGAPDAGHEEERERVEDPGAELRDLQRVGEGGKHALGALSDDRLAPGLLYLGLGRPRKLRSRDLEGAGELTVAEHLDHGLAGADEAGLREARRVDLLD